jgi:hypothetical protein
MYKVYLGTMGKDKTLRKLYFCLTDRKVQIYSGQWFSINKYFPTINDAISYCYRSKGIFNFLLNSNIHRQMEHRGINHVSTN